MLRLSPLLIAAFAALAVVACHVDEPSVATKESVAKPPPAKVEAAAEPAPALENTDSKGLLATVDAMKAQLKDKPRDFAIDLALGNLFFDNGRYTEALEYFGDAAKIVDASEAALIETKGLPAAKRVPDACVLGDGSKHDERTVESLQAAWQGLRPRSPEAVACLRALGPKLAELRSKQGNAWYLAGNVDKASEMHEHALAIDPDFAESLFFKGAHMLENAKGDAAKLAAGRAVWEQLLKVAPTHPRADIVRETMPRIDELFGAKADRIAPMPAAQGPAALPAGVAEAMAKVERTPALEKELDDKLVAGDALLAKGEWQQALDTFKAVMPLRPDGRVALGLGVALRELGKPTAERVLMQAAQMPNADVPRARYELAVFYEKSNPSQARAIYAELASDASWGAKAKARLASMK